MYHVTIFFSQASSMYVPPTFRQTKKCNLKINNLCDEFLHIDETPEAHLKEKCVHVNQTCLCIRTPVLCQKSCMRKSVTCVCIVQDLNGDMKYEKVYKNENVGDSSIARHAEMFFISDEQLRKELQPNQVITIFLTFQPCHYSGGHHKPSNMSCTESLIYFNDKILKPLHICLKIRFAYLYRAHWKLIENKYEEMVYNANVGLKLLLDNFDVKVIDENDIHHLIPYFDENTKEMWNDSNYVSIIQQRKPLQDFITNYLESTKNPTHM